MSTFTNLGMSALPASQQTQRQRMAFTNPFSIATGQNTRQARSSSASSIASTTSSLNNPTTLNEILSLSYSTTSRNASLTSLTTSRRPSCFSIAEVEEEKAEFGEQLMSLLEPRNSIGFWGVKEVIVEEEMNSRRSSLS